MNRWPGSLTARRLGWLVIAALALHALLLRELRDALPARQRASPGPPLAAVHVRTLTQSTIARAEPAVTRAALDAPPAPAPVHATQGPARRPATNVAGPTDTVARAAALPLTLARSSSASQGNVALPLSLIPSGDGRPKAASLGHSLPATGAAAAPTDTPAATAEPGGAAPGSAPPVYRTLIAPAFTFRYDLRRGAASGSADLHWQPEGERYRARLAATGVDAPPLAWESAGGFDSAGLAPERHTDRPRGRAAQAANFQRQAGKVTFSGPAVEHALPPGTQDRLSWMLQLAGIAAADPARVGPGGQVTLLVIGARGDADLWTFVHAGHESLALPGGDTPAVRLLREPRRAHDTRAEVWLDPARHHLPVRARLSNPPGGNALELELREVLAAP